MQAFAASAATAVATAQTASNEALRRSVQASEHERRRWARELHDETLQELAGLKMLLSGARRSDEPERLRGAIDQALEMITQGIANLRALIIELRPAALDELGPEPAVQALVERVRAQSGLEIELDVRLAYEEGRTPLRHVTDIEAAVYRLVQEALNNVVKHAEATRVAIRIADPTEDDGQLLVEVEDDGRGFDPAIDSSGGFGLLGMRERVALVHGELTVTSSPGRAPAWRRASRSSAARARIPLRGLRALAADGFERFERFKRDQQERKEGTCALLRHPRLRTDAQRARRETGVIVDAHDDHPGVAIPPCPALVPQQAVVHHNDVGPRLLHGRFYQVWVRDRGDDSHPRRVRKNRGERGAPESRSVGEQHVDGPWIFHSLSMVRLRRE